MPVERNTPQLVKKGKGKKRPGYRGPGEYQGGRGYGGSKSSKGGDKGTGGSKGNLGGGGGGQDSNYRRYSPPTKKTYTSKTIDSKPVTGKDYRDSRNDFVNTLNRNNQIAAERAGTRFTPYQGGARNTSYYKPNPLSGLLKLAAGFAFPGAGFLLNQGGKLKDGLMGLNDSIQNSDFGRSTSLMDYLDMKKFGGYNEREMARRINMDEAKNLQARIDGGEFGGFGIQTPKAKPTFSDPFANTVGTTTKVNAPTSDAVSSNSIPTVNGVPMINTGSVYQDNLNFFDNLNKGIVEGGTLTDNYKYKVPFEGARTIVPNPDYKDVMQGSVLDAKPKKGIMQMISDAIFSPAGADEFDMEAFQKAGADKGLFGANDELEAIKEYYDAAKSLTAPGGKFAGANDPAAVRNFITQQSAIPFGGGSYGVEMGMIPENFMNKTEDFTTQKDPLSFFADGGLASMFTRRG